jgi:branched-chain amino acid transport system permease protein
MKTLFKDHQLDTPLLLSLLLLALMLLAELFGAPGLQRTLTETLIRLVVVVGLYLFIGNSGVMSFGHVAFMGVGAYVAAWTTMDPAIKQFVLPGLPALLQSSSMHWLLATLLAGLFTALVGLLCGALILRLTGIATSIASFALLAIFNVVYSNWDSVTAGTSSIVGIPTTVQLWQAGAFAMGSIVLAHFYSISRFGLALRSVREEPVASLSCGVNAYRQLLIAFVLSTLVCGVGGALDAQYLGVVNPDAYYLGRTFFCLAMLVVGGVSTLSGAVTGVLALSALTEVLNRLEAGLHIGTYTLSIPTGAQEIVIGVLMIVVLIVRPKGLVGRREWRWKHAA